VAPFSGHGVYSSTVILWFKKGTQLVWKKQQNKYVYVAVIIIKTFTSNVHFNFPRSSELNTHNIA